MKPAYGFSFLLALVGGWILGRSAFAQTFDEADSYLRVVAISAPVRSGPGGSYFEIGRVGQGQIYKSMEWSSDRAWARIRLGRGQSGWIFTELAWPFRIVKKGAWSKTRNWFSNNILGDSPLQDGKISMNVVAGVLGQDGTFSLGIGYWPSRHYWLGLSACQTMGDFGNLLTYHAQTNIAIGPWRSFIPFAAVGAGGATFLPHRHAEMFRQKTHPSLLAGLGFLIALKNSILLRLEADRLMLFSSEQAWSQISIKAGVTLVF